MAGGHGEEGNVTTVLPILVMKPTAYPLPYPSSFSRTTGTRRVLVRTGYSNIPRRKGGNSVRSFLSIFAFCFNLFSVSGPL